MKKLKKNGFEIVVTVICLLVLGFFVSMKQGFHMDELLSFELSNAEFNPWIVTTQPEGRLAKFVHNEIDGETFGETMENLAAEIKDVLKNRGNSKLLTYEADVYEEPVWISAEQFRDYIEVDNRDAFHYLSVYFNVKDDNHPPLHFMLLHTVCSLFQGRAEAWMGCLINLGAVAAVLVLLIKAGRLLAGAAGLQNYSRLTGVMAALLYGMSAGAVATTLLIRMYGMVTLWCVAYFYLIIKKWRDRDFERHNAGLILVTMLGFWTQYFFLFYCIILAGTLCVLLIWQRRKKELGCFIRSMVIAAVAGLAVFPFAVSDVFSSGRGVEALDNLAAGFTGYGARLLSFLGIVGGRTFFPLLWVLLAVSALTMAVLHIFGKEKREADIQTDGEEPETVSGAKAKGCGAYIWMLVFPTVGYFLLAARMSPYLVDRYMMPVFPFVALTGALFLSTLPHAFEKKCGKAFGKRLAAAVCLTAGVMQAAGLTRYDGSYLYQGYALQEAVARENAGYPCICVYEGVGYYENLKEFTYYDKSLLLTTEELENRTDRESIQTLEKVALLIKADEVDVQHTLEIMEESYGFVPETWGWRGPGIHGDVLCFMTKKQAE